MREVDTRAMTTKTAVVLVMHGAPPRDFPREELSEFFRLHSMPARGGGPQAEKMRSRHDELEEKMRAWPRTPENDPFYAASEELAGHLSQAAGYAVYLSFNEFCAPTLGQALEDAVQDGAGRIFIITPMMTRGGQHAEEEIPAVIEEFRARYAAVRFTYVWPFPFEDIAEFLAGQIRRAAGSTAG